MADLAIKFDIQVSRDALRGGLAALLLLSFSPELGSESVTLTTYYPAPSGVYTQMITTANTYLARDGGFVGVGTTSTLAAGDKMAVIGGDVGIGVTNPSQLLAVQGDITLGNADADAGYALRFRTRSDLGLYESGYGLQLMAPERVVISIDSNNNNVNASFAVVGNTAVNYGATATALPANTLFMVREDGNVGVGTTDPRGTVDVNGNIVARQSCGSPQYHMYSGTTGGNVTLTDGPAGNHVNGDGTNCNHCTATQYVTPISGVMLRYYQMPPSESSHVGYICCDCPTGTCPSL